VLRVFGENFVMSSETDGERVTVGCGRPTDELAEMGVEVEPTVAVGTRFGRDARVVSGDSVAVMVVTSADRSASVTSPSAAVLCFPSSIEREGEYAAAPGLLTGVSVRPAASCCPRVGVRCFGGVSDASRSSSVTRSRTLLLTVRVVGSDAERGSTGVAVGPSRRGEGARALMGVVFVRTEDAEEAE
jgi:hypothetical protein